MRFFLLVRELSIAKEGFYFCEWRFFFLHECFFFIFHKWGFVLANQGFYLLPNEGFYILQVRVFIFLQLRVYSLFFANKVLILANAGCLERDGFYVLQEKNLIFANEGFPFLLSILVFANDGFFSLQMYFFIFWTWGYIYGQKKINNKITNIVQETIYVYFIRIVRWIIYYYE